MNRYVVFALKFAGVWLALIIGQMAGGMIGQMLTHAAPPAMKPDGPLSLTAAIVVAAGLFAVVLSAMAPAMQWSFWGRFAALFGLLYGLESLLSLIEAIYFNAYVHMTDALLWMMAVGNAVKAVLAALVCALLWRGESQPAERFSGLAWKIPVIIPLYIVFYFGAGALIAWQSADVRAYYAQGFHIDQGQLALLQVGRGLIWALLALLSVASLTGGTWKRAVLTGLAFSVFMAATLLYPNPLMPWSVRHVHLVEVGVSNFLFGILAALILLGKVRHPTTTPSARSPL
ncbi:hypothetical protein [Asticcacaulis taihuensis]|uniref:Uncharacterized protein n=1 Tax=Asticcacaulis taihuensis TaxID=260084 RepID=A0A1G4TSE2_9CAUL|nr:hypothetical protein [Asticcacaulis taihuensis]SCW84250.1 hypothetical protein SAMN02927928_0134 [Asticcacaulis taihuensis]